MDEKLDYQFAHNAKSLWKAHQLLNSVKKNFFHSIQYTIHVKWINGWLFTFSFAFFSSFQQKIQFSMGDKWWKVLISYAYKSFFFFHYVYFNLQSRIILSIIFKWHYWICGGMINFIVKPKNWTRHRQLKIKPQIVE
jgi:hypothetical protein